MAIPWRRTSYCFAACVLALTRQLHAANFPPTAARTVLIADANLEVAAPAKWIVPLTFARLPKTAKIDPGEEQRWLLLDRQINARENERFSHSVRQILTSAGVQNGSHITIDFDPSYQNLALHWVRLWRGTNLLNRLQLEKVKVIQQERDLDQYLFSGEKSAVLLLEDVRAGDIVDYAYTIRGDNPALAGKFSGAVEVQRQETIERLTTRLLWPVQRRLFQKNHGSVTKPIVLRSADFFEFIWDVKGLAGVRLEDSLPTWYNPFSWVQLSEYEKWADVSQWAQALFRDAAPPAPELQQKINEWRRIAGKEERVAAVLQFVQDEVRYLGIEIGPNSFKPTSSSLVFSQRFGDCKDKTLLLVTVLRALGIEANPVLVNTKWRHTIDQWQPSVAAFDHAIAQVRIDGRTFWLDATGTSERGPLAARYWPDYGRGLVIAPSTVALTFIPRCTVSPRTTLTEYFQVRGIDQSTDLKIVTVGEGPDAEVLRERFARTARQDLEKNYLNARAAEYPGIQAAGAIEFFDDERQNRVSVTEYYTIERMWSQTSDQGNYQCRFSASNVDAALVKPAVAFRSMPLALRFPRHEIFRAEINLPRNWLVPNENRTIEDPNFSYRIRRTTALRQLTLEYEYQSLADSVPPNQVGRYVQHLDDAFHDVGYSLFWR
jgi:transglutaminase-like putative cysteine protease